MKTLKEKTTQLESCLGLALSKLDARSCELIHRRYGLIGRTQPRKDVAAAHRLSEERIRQIETKALRSMRQVFQRLWASHEKAHHGEVWQTLAGDDGIVLARDLPLSRQQPSPWILLALDLLEITLEDLLDSCANASAGDGLRRSRASMS